METRAGLARDYLGCPSRTAASFLPDPFAERPGERMSPTGDNVRLQSDGNYVYVGRIDNQIKISGSPDLLSYGELSFGFFA